MVTLKIFEPALCCATGACGPRIDNSLVQFAADVEWLKALGVTIARANLAQNPAAFAENEAVVRELREGLSCLPLMLVDGHVASRGNYPSRQQLAEWCGLSIPSQLTLAKVSCCGGQPCR